MESSRIMKERSTKAYFQRISVNFPIMAALCLLSDCLKKEIKLTLTYFFASRLLRAYASISWACPVGELSSEAFCFEPLFVIDGFLKLLGPLGRHRSIALLLFYGLLRSGLLYYACLCLSTPFLSDLSSALPLRLVLFVISLKNTLLLHS